MFLHKKEKSACHLNKKCPWLFWNNLVHKNGCPIQMCALKWETPLFLLLFHFLHLQKKKKNTALASERTELQAAGNNICRRACLKCGTSIEITIHLHPKSDLSHQVCRPLNIEMFPRRNHKLQRQKWLLKLEHFFKKSCYCAPCGGSTRPRSCRSWIQVKGPLCHWSGPRSVEATAAAPCSPWAGWAVLQGSGPPAGHSGSPAAAPGSWCSAWPDAGSRSCSASSPEDGWGWACGAQQRRRSRCAGASAPWCWWTPFWSWCWVGLQWSTLRKINQRFGH